MSSTIDKGFYTLQFAIGTDPLDLTGLYAADPNLAEHQILLKQGPDFDTESWFISPVTDKDNTYLITRSVPEPRTPGFAPDANFDKVVLSPPVRWFFYRVEGPDVPPDVYFICPVDVPHGRLGVDFYLGPSDDKDGVVITRVPVVQHPPPAPAWQVLPSPINAK